METVNHIHRYENAEPGVRIKLERNSRGYNWEVAYEHLDLNTALAKVREANERLQAEYGGQA